MSDQGDLTPLMDVQIARLHLQVPMVEDEETTLGIIDSLNRRIARIEKESTRVDSTAFALLAAFELAAESLRLEQEAEADSMAIARRLDHLNDVLQDLLSDMDDDT